MTYEFLPREEPGKPLMRVPPGFADGVMQRIEDYDRQQKRRWTISIALAAVCLLGGGFLLSARLMDVGGKAGVPRVQAGPVTPPVKAAPVPDLAAWQSALKKRDTPVPVPAAHDHPMTTASADDPPGFVVIMLDGREYHCPPEVLQRMNHGNGDEQIETVRNDGKPPKETAHIQPFSGGPCRFVPAPKQ